MRTSEVSGLRRGNVVRLGTLAGAVALAASLTTIAVDVPANAATTYVVNSGSSACSDAGSGTLTQPFCTIAAAAKVAHAGDTVQIFAGTYSGTSVNPANSGTAGSPITFAAQPGVTISGGTSAFALSSRNYIDVSGFSVSATSSAGFVVSNGTNDVIANNVITGTGSYGISISGGSNDTVSGNTESFAGTPQTQPAAGIYLHNLSGGLVQSNVTHDNSAHGIYLTGTTTGVLVEGNTSYRNAYQYERNANGIDDIAPANSLIGNITYANEDTGINIYTGGDNALIADNVTYGNGDHGIDDYNVTGGRIINNTVYGNCTDGINVEGTSGGYTVEDNVSMNNATGAVINPTPILQTNGKPDYTNLCNRRVGNIGIYDSAPATSTADYNVVWQSGPGAEYSWAGTTYSTQAALYAATGQEQHGIFANPGFVNAAAANFQLMSGSPAIDKANTSVSGHQPTDILGVSPYDDMGAYEYASAGSPTGPAAALTVTPATGTAPLSVTADASRSTAGSSPISTYTFNFGDGTTTGPQTAATATHAYQAAGTYTVTVTVTDTSSLTAQATQTVTANPAVTGPAAALTVTPATGTAPLSVTADASRSTAGSSPISTYTFNFGDGTTTGPQTAATATHAYQAAGTYTVTVTVTDTSSLTAQATQTVTANPAVTGPAAALTVTPATGTAPLSVTADASGSTAGSSPISTYTFNFGDGTTTGPQTAATATHAYQAAGTYTVTVTVTDTSSLTAQATQTVTANPAVTGPAAALTVTPATGTAPLSVTADASGSTAGSSPISTYTFNFGDGTTTGPQTAATATHAYQAAGTYTVTVTVTDTSSLTAQATQTVTANPAAAATAKYVNQIATNYSTSSHTSGYVTVWRTGGVAAGDLIIATVQLTGTTIGTVTGTDTLGDALGVVSDVSDGHGDRLVTVAGVALAGLPVNDQVIINFPQAATYRMTADEVSGVTTADEGAAASGTAGAFSSGTTAPTARGGEFVYSVVATFGGTSITWPAGWTAETTYTVGSNALGRAYQVPTAIGTFAATGTVNGGWLAEVIAFK